MVDALLVTAQLRQRHPRTQRRAALSAGSPQAVRGQARARLAITLRTLPVPGAKMVQFIK